MRGEGVVVMECAVAFEVVELAQEVPGLHAVVAGGEAGPTGLHLDGQLLKFILEVVEVCLFIAVLYHLRVCWPVG